MNRSSTIFLKLVLLLVAAPVVVGMLWFPQIEGRATNLDLVSIYKDPFIMYIYIASIPFFGAFYQAFKLLGLIEKNKAFSLNSVKALRNIKYCGMVFAGFIVLAMPYIMLIGQDEDAPGVVLIGIIMIFASATIATAAAVFQKLLQNAVDIKSENDLTV